MSKKLAVLFPGVGYSVDRPLLYYSKKMLKSKGFEVVCIKYTGLEQENIFDASKNELLENGVAGNKVSKQKLLAFVTKAKDVANSQLAVYDLTKYDQLVFVSKSVGTVVGAICAKQLGVNPYHFMLTPMDYAFSFIEDGEGSVFSGTSDPLVNNSGLQDSCKALAWDYHSFKDANHSLETGDVDVDIEYLKRYLSTLDHVVSDMEKSIYDIQVTTRNQTVKRLDEYKGKVLLIVNTATGCGFTPQYQALEDMYERYQEQGFEILDFPCNQFANQAPGSDAEIYSFCTSRYEISFEQFSKINVNGEHQSELFEFLKSRKGFKGFDMSKQDSQYLAKKLEKETPDYESTSDIKWNFTKFLVNRKGQIIERFEPTTDLGQVEAAVARLVE